MNKKFFCAALAALMVASCGVVSASAADVTTEASQATGTIKFDMGDWDHSDNLAFYVFDTTANEFCSKKGWSDTNPWGSKKLDGTAVEGEDGIVESYEIDLSGREDHTVLVIFHDRTSNAQTYDCVLTQDAFGHTARTTGSTVENPVDSEKVAIEASFDGVDSCGPHMQITSTGHVVGTCTAPGDNPVVIIAKYVLNSLGKLDKSGEEIVTEEKVANAIKEFGTNANDVWDTYLTFAGEENYNEEGAKAMIKPTEAAPEDTSSEESSQVTSSDTSSVTSSSPVSEPDTSSAASTTSTASTKTTSDVSSQVVSPTSSSTSSSASSASSSSKASTSSNVTSPKTGRSAAFGLVPVLMASFAAMAAVISGRRKDEE